MALLKRFMSLGHVIFANKNFQSAHDLSAPKVQKDQLHFLVLFRIPHVLAPLDVYV